MSAGQLQRAVGFGHLLQIHTAVHRERFVAHERNVAVPPDIAHPGADHQQIQREQLDIRADERLSGVHERRELEQAAKRRAA